MKTGEVRALKKRVQDAGNRSQELREESRSLATGTVWLESVMEEEMHFRAVAVDFVAMYKQQEAVVANLTAQVVRMTNLYNEAVLPPYETQLASLLSTQHDAASERTHFVNMVK